MLQKEYPEQAEKLVEAFKATLEEAVLSDFLIHVLDANAPEAFAFYDTTVEVLNELGAEGKPVSLPNS